MWLPLPINRASPAPEWRLSSSPPGPRGPLVALADEAFGDTNGTRFHVAGTLEQRARSVPTDVLEVAATSDNTAYSAAGCQ